MFASFVYYIHVSVSTNTDLLGSNALYYSHHPGSSRVTFDIPKEKGLWNDFFRIFDNFDAVSVHVQCGNLAIVENFQGLVREEIYSNMETSVKVKCKM